MNKENAVQIVPHSDYAPGNEGVVRGPVTGERYYFVPGEPLEVADPDADVLIRAGVWVKHHVPTPKARKTSSDDSE